MEVNLEEKKTTINAAPASLPTEACHFIISPVAQLIQRRFPFINIVIICCSFIFMLK